MIESKQNPRIKAARKLTQKKYRVKENKMLIEGAHLLEEAAHTGVLEASFHLGDNPDFPRGARVSEAVMKHLSASAHPPRDIGVASIPSAKAAGKRVLILENIQDPGNVGTLIRSALAFGFDTVITDESADCYSPKVLRSTQGAVFHISVHAMDVETFKKSYPAHTLVGAHLHPSPVRPSKPLEPFALVLGNEGSGLSESTVAMLDVSIAIPITTIDSLNVAVAGGIIMHALTAKEPLSD